MMKSPHSPLMSAGWTLVELVVTMVILSTLSAYAAPKFFEQTTYDNRTSHDALLLAMRYAQKRAFSSGCQVQFSLNVRGYLAKTDLKNECNKGNFSLALQDPNNPGESLDVTFRYMSVSATPSLPQNVIFYPDGTISKNLEITTDIRNIKMFSDTGFIYEP